MKILDVLLPSYNRYMAHQGRVRAREILLNSSDRILEDLGLSRELLESGVKAWPWRKAAPELGHLHFYEIGKVITNLDAHAGREFQNDRDKELHDSGISRDSIVDAELPDRDDIENNNRERQVA